MKRILESREKELKKIIRYEGAIMKPMFYTPELSIHIQRVKWNVVKICEALNLDEDTTREVLLMTEYHDDDEIIAGDVQAPVKEAWTIEQKNEYEELCRNATQILIDNYGSSLGNDYARILEKMEQTKEDSLLKAIVDYADKLDAHMEICHELYAGNQSFMMNLKEVYGIDRTPFTYTSEKIKKRKEKIEALTGMKLETGIFDVNNRINLDIRSIVNSGSKHTADSVQIDTGDHLYDLRIQNHFDYGTDEQIRRLYEQNVTYSKKD